MVRSQVHQSISLVHFIPACMVCPPTQQKFTVDKSVNVDLVVTVSGTFSWNHSLNLPRIQAELVCVSHDKQLYYVFSSVNRKFFSCQIVEHHVNSTEILNFGMLSEDEGC